MQYNCERTRLVSRESQSTNNGYWYKDNKAYGRIITMSTRVNGEGLKQRTVFLLQWGAERARCPVQQYLLSQGQQGWGPNELTIATRLSHHSKCQDALEWAAAEVRLIILAHSRLLIYPRRLKEWQFSCFPGIGWTESRAYGRAEESSGTQEGVVT